MLINARNIKDYYEKRWVEPMAYSRPPGLHALRVMAAHIRRGTECLDVGCGDAHILGPWIEEVGGQYTGVDISENAVNHARSLGLNAHAVEDAAALPFHDSSFDMVLCMEVLEHLFEPQVATREILRVLRPQGVFISSVPNVTHWWQRLQFCFAGRWDPYGDSLSVEQPWRDPHIRFFTAPTLERMLRLTGFEAVSVIGEQPARVQRMARVTGRLAKGLNYSHALPIVMSRRLIAVARKPNPGSDYEHRSADPS